MRTIFILTTTVILLAGCGTESVSPDLESRNQNDLSDSDRPRVALIMKSLANEFFSTMAAGAESHQQEHSSDYELVINGIRDERDLSRQVALVDEMVSSGVSAIVIAPADSKALIPALRKAQQAGVIVVNIDNRLDSEVLQQEGVSIPFVGPNNKTGARQVGDYLASKLDAGDTVLMLEGITTSFNAQQRRDGFKEAMQAAGINVADSQSADWEMSRASTITASMLNEHPDARAVLAANDSMALGAMAAARTSGRDDSVLIVGFDNISAVQDAIRQGRILATADQHGGQLAVFGIEAALGMLTDPDAAPEDVETPVDLITLETLSRD